MGHSVFSEVRKDTMFPWFWCHFRETFRIWVLKNVCGHRDFWVLNIIYELLKPFKKISQNGRPKLDCHSSCSSVWGFRFCLAPVSWSRIVTSLCGWTWWGQVLWCRCWRRIASRTGWQTGNDKSTMLSVLHINFFTFFFNRGFLTTDPLIDITILFAEFAQCQDSRRVIEYWHCHEKLKIVNVYMCFLVCLHFSFGRYYRCGFLDFWRVSSSHEFK